VENARAWHSHVSRRGIRLRQVFAALRDGPCPAQLTRTSPGVWVLAASLDGKRVHVATILAPPPRSWSDSAIGVAVRRPDLLPIARLARLPQAPEGTPFPLLPYLAARAAGWDVWLVSYAPQW
jgi:hypothetical protein